MVTTINRTNMTANGTGKPRKIDEAQLEEILTDDPLASGYHPTLPVTTMWGADGFPDFYLYRDIEAMMAHPSVFLPVNYYKSAISKIEVKITSNSQEVKAFVEQEFKAFWQRDVPKVQNSYEWGWNGSEILYDTKDGYLCQAGLLDFAARDVTVLVEKSQNTGRKRYLGFRVKNTQTKNKVDLWGHMGGIEEEIAPGHWIQIPTKVPAKGFWFAHRPRYGQFYGRSQLHGAWRPWRRLAARDGLEYIMDMAIYRFGVAGPLVRYPQEMLRNSNGQPIDPRQKAREMGEKQKAGMVVVAPSTKYPAEQGGDFKWTFDQPDHTINVSGLGEQADRLEKQIAKGIGVAPELLEAMDTGSGYSGRAIPLESFLAAVQQDANAIAQAWVEQIGKPLVRWNFGDAASFELEVMSLLETKMKSRQGQQPGAGMPLQPPEAGGPASGAPPEMGAVGAPLQFSIKEIGPLRWGKIVTEEATHVRIVGSTGSGKSVMAQAIATNLPGRVIVIDPVWRPGNWGGLPAVTITSDGGYEDIEKALYALLDEMKKRGAELQSGKRDFERLTIIWDEVPDTVAELPDIAGLLIRRLAQRGRHGNMHLIGIGQSDRVGAWGIAGFGDVPENFVTILLGDKATDKIPEMAGQERPAIIEWHAKTYPIDVSGVLEMSRKEIPRNHVFYLPGVHYVGKTEEDTSAQMAMTHTWREGRSGRGKRIAINEHGEKVYDPARVTSLLRVKERRAPGRSAQEIANVPWESFKKVGHSAIHVEHVIHEYVADGVKKNLARLPEKVQTWVAAVWKAVRLGTKAVFISYVAGEKLAEEVAKEKGATEEEAKRLRWILTAFDVGAAKVVPLTLAAIGLGAAAIPAYWTPIGSAIYLACSTATNPLATLRAARTVIKGLNPREMKLSLAIHGNHDIPAQIIDVLRAHPGKEDWFTALLLSAAEGSKTLEEAFRKAELGMKHNPTE